MSDPDLSLITEESVSVVRAAVGRAVSGERVETQPGVDVSARSATIDAVRMGCGQAVQQFIQSGTVPAKILSVPLWCKSVGFV